MRRVIVGLTCAALALALGANAMAAATAPANDGFASAQTLAGVLPLIASGTTVGATREAGESVAAGAGHSVWY